MNLNFLNLSKWAKFKFKLLSVNLFFKLKDMEDVEDTTLLETSGTNTHQDTYSYVN